MKTIQQDLKSNNLSPNESMGLSIVHFGDCLVLCIPSGVCQKDDDESL